MKTYGTITYDSNKWIIDKAEPHVCIKLKNIFPSIPKTGVVPFEFGNTPEICHDLIWFMARYPLTISTEDIKRIESGRGIHVSIMNDMERILVPDYVPKEIILKEGKKARSYQLVAKEMHSRIKRFLLGDDMGLGKCHGIGTKIMMYGGDIKNVEDIVVGDELMGDDSTPRKVLSLARGQEEMFKISPLHGGDPFIINKSHVMVFHVTPHRNHKTSELRKMGLIEKPFGEWLDGSKRMKRFCKLIRTSVKFNENRIVKIDPYFIGLWLGDGHWEGQSISVNISTDKEIVKYLDEYADSLGLYTTSIKSENSGDDYRKISIINNRTQQKDGNVLRKMMNSYNLRNQSKILPHELMTCSIKDRKLMLAGYIDSDGNKVCNGVYDILSKRKELSEQILFLARSVGYTACLNIKNVLWTGNAGNKLRKDGKSRNEVRKDYYRITISGAYDVPVKLERKKSHAQLINKNTLVTGFEYESLGIGDYYGFTLDGNGRYLLGDTTITHNTLSAIICCMNEGALPATIVVQSHLTRQWKEAIEEFTNLTVHIIKSVKIYNVPNADVYIFSYHKLSGWVDVFKNSPFRSATFDEVQELRRPESNKYTAAKILSNSVDYCMGLSGTPVINYGNEIHSILSIIKPNCLGKEEDFMREWTTNGKVVNDPKALGGYLRDNYLMLRRTRKDVGRELPPTNKIIHTIDYDHAQAEKAADIARMLAIKATTGSFLERGQASRELDAFARHQTGVAKAHYIAEFVKILLDNDEPVLLGIWHRDVYDVIEEELKEYNPVFYSGEETQRQKDISKNAFINGESKLLVMSIRSGVGIDGLQNVCNTVVIGELDYSGKIMEQFITRVDRDGQPEQVTVFYLVCDDGSDPVLMDIIGLKNSQAHGIVDPLLAVSEQHSDESRAKLLADYYLKKRNITT